MCLSSDLSSPGLSQSVHPKLCKSFLSNFNHVNESDEEEEEEDQNGILTLFGIEMAKKISHIIKSETA